MAQAKEPVEVVSPQKLLVTLKIAAETGVTVENPHTSRTPTAREAFDTINLQNTLKYNS